MINTGGGRVGVGVGVGAGVWLSGSPGVSGGSGGDWETGCLDVGVMVHG